MDLTWLEHQGTRYFKPANQNMPSVYVLQYVETSVTIFKYSIVPELQQMIISL